MKKRERGYVCVNHTRACIRCRRNAKFDKCGCQRVWESIRTPSSINSLGNSDFQQRSGSEDACAWSRRDVTGGATAPHFVY